MAVRQPPSDVEKLAKNRILIASMLLYLLCVGFMTLGDRIYAGTEYLLYSRLAVIPFFLLLLRRWQRLVRIKPPPALREARQVMALGRHRAAREKFLQVPSAVPAGELARIDRELQAPAVAGQLEQGGSPRLGVERALECHQILRRPGRVARRVRQ